MCRNALWPDLRRWWSISLLLLLFVTGCGAAKDIVASAAGATAKCADGTYTNNRVPDAGCQGHGGVDEYLNTSDSGDRPRVFTPEGRWAGTWTGDASPALNGEFSLIVQVDGTAEGAFRSGGISGTVRGTVQVSDNPVALAPPATELVLQSAVSGEGLQTVIYSAVFNRPAPNRLIGKLTRISPGEDEAASAFPDSSCTVELARQ